MKLFEPEDLLKAAASRSRMPSESGRYFLLGFGFVKTKKYERKRTRGKLRLPRVPLPRQTGGVHEDKTKRPFRKQKHRNPPTDES